MPTSVDAQTVTQVARLAKIQFTEEQLDNSAKQLAEILDYVGQLEQVDLPAEVEPFFGAIESVNAIRADENQPSVDRETILQNAPRSDGEFYVVPPVFK